MMAFCVRSFGDTRAKMKRVDARADERKSTHVHATNKLIFNRYLRLLKMTFYDCVVATTRQEQC